MTNIHDKRLNAAKSLTTLMLTKHYRYRGYPIEILPHGFILYGDYFSSKEGVERYVDENCKDWGNRIIEQNKPPSPKE